jgi:hypothetical protein
MIVRSRSAHLDCSMPREEIREAVDGRYVSVTLYCTKEETERIADAASAVDDWIKIFTALDPMTVTLIRAAPAILAWKARRCLKHGKCLGLVVSALCWPFEYDP